LRDTLEQGLAGWVKLNRKPALIPDSSLDERWLQRPNLAPKSAICVPLMSKEHLVGILTLVHPKPNFFNQEHLDLLQSIADQAGIAVKNAQLYASLESAHSRYLELFEDSIDPILITDMTGKINETNRQAVQTTGYEPARLLDLMITDIFAVDEAITGKKMATLKKPGTVSFESNLITAVGKKVPIQVYVRKVKIEEGESIQWILRDITERKKLDELRTDLTAMIYHDLRSPLSNIVSSLDMLSAMMPSEKDSSLESVFGIATRSTERLLRLINSLLDIDRLEAGQPITDRKVVSPADLVNEAVEAVMPFAIGKQQIITKTLDTDLPDVCVDPDMIKRVLINLLENALKYSPAGGKITTGGKASGEWVELWVQDSGPGIPPDSRDIVFEKFSRLQNTERSTKGMGLGLAFCRLAVTAHGGKINVDNQVSEGSKFVFFLPSFGPCQT
jgi:PAS domain S-box-containing protein